MDLLLDNLAVDNIVLTKLKDFWKSPIELKYKLKICKLPVWTYGYLICNLF